MEELHWINERRGGAVSKMSLSEEPEPKDGVLSMDRKRAIDGTHIPIAAPSVNEADYVNRKRIHSINVQESMMGTCLGTEGYPCQPFLLTPYTDPSKVINSGTMRPSVGLEPGREYNRHSQSPVPVPLGTSG
ncbi:hypothetical protein GJAV_G00001420 [Gymnothorax javanicus]|nr:hypothetical protein GJAV_G00001420 [Gymnothorax javanicus]